MIGHQCPEDYQDHQASATSLVSSFCTLEDLAQTFGKGSEPVIDSTKTSVNSELQLVKRLRGGAGNNFSASKRNQENGVRLASRINFCIQPGTPNPARGNCLFESAIFNIKDRPELPQVDQMPDDIQECRTLWVTMFQTQIPNFAPELNAYTEEQWNDIKRDGVYETALGDVMPFCIAYATKKRILILHAYETAEVPLSIVEPETFGQDRDCDIPICLVYSKTHYDSVHPVGKHIEKSIELFDQTKLDRQCTFLPSTDVKSMLGPLTKAEKMRRSRLVKSLNGGAPYSVFSQKVMTPDEKRQKETARKQLYRQQNPEQYAAEKAKKSISRQQNPEQYAAEKAERGSDALITLLAEQAQNPYKFRVQLLKHMFGDYCDRDLFVNAFKKQLESLSEAEVGSILCERMCYFWCQMLS